MEKILKPIPNLFGTSFDGIISGVYKITSPSGKVYIGESKNIYNRWRQYKWLQTDGQAYLHNSLNKYGVDNHRFEIIHILKLPNIFIESIHRQILYDYECLFIQQYKDNGFKMLNLTDGGRDGYYIDEHGDKVILNKPKFVYKILNTQTSEIEFVYNISQFIKDNKLGCEKRLTGTLYGYDRMGVTCNMAKGFIILSKNYIDNPELDTLLQEKIKNELEYRLSIRKSKNMVKLGSPEYNQKCGDIQREFIYTYIDVKTLKIGTIENVKKFCREHHSPIKDDKQLFDTLYGINNQGNVVSHCHGVKLISKRFRDITKDCSIIDQDIEEMKNKRFAKRKLEGKTDEGSPEHLSRISKKSSKYVYTIFNIITNKKFIVDNVSTFMSSYKESILPKNFSSIVETIYQYTTKGYSLKSCNNFVTLEKHYIDKNLDDNKLQEEIKNEILKRKILNNLIPKDGYKVLHIESNDIKTVPNMAEFCEQNKLVPNYLLKTYKFPTYQHRGYRLVEKFTYYSDVNNPFEK